MYMIQAYQYAEQYCHIMYLCTQHNKLMGKKKTTPSSWQYRFFVQFLWDILSDIYIAISTLHINTHYKYFKKSVYVTFLLQPFTIYYNKKVSDWLLFTTRTTRGFLHTENVHGTGLSTYFWANYTKGMNCLVLTSCSPQQAAFHHPTHPSSGCWPTRAASAAWPPSKTSICTCPRDYVSRRRTWDYGFTTARCVCVCMCPLLDSGLFNSMLILDLDSTGCIHASTPPNHLDWQVESEAVLARVVTPSFKLPHPSHLLGF